MQMANTFVIIYNLTFILHQLFVRVRLDPANFLKSTYMKRNHLKNTEENDSNVDTSLKCLVKFTYLSSSTVCEVPLSPSVSSAALVRCP